MGDSEAGVKSVVSALGARAGDVDTGTVEAVGKQTLFRPYLQKIKTFAATIYIKQNVDLPVGLEVS